MKVFCINCKHRFYLYTSSKCKKSGKEYIDYDTGEKDFLYKDCFIYNISGECKYFELKISDEYKKELLKLSKRILKQSVKNL
jgi:hypothetical protein